MSESPLLGLYAADGTYREKKVRNERDESHWHETTRIMPAGIAGKGTGTRTYWHIHTPDHCVGRQSASR